MQMFQQIVLHFREPCNCGETIFFLFFFKRMSEKSCLAEKARRCIARVEINCYSARFLFFVNICGIMHILEKVYERPLWMMLAKIAREVPRELKLYSWEKNLQDFSGEGCQLHRCETFA